MESTVTLNFWDVEPGWSCIFFTHPPRQRKSRLHSLLTSLEAWRQQHPQRRIEHIQVAKDQNVIRGLNVFWSVFEHLKDVSKIAHFHIDEEIRRLYGHEYAEALMEDAVAFASQNVQSGNVVMISRRKVAIVLVRATEQAYVTQLETFLRTVRLNEADGILRNFENWLARDDYGYFVVILPDDYRAST